METVNVNRASEKDLQKIKGVGKVRAAKIVQNRPFRDLYELSKIAGLGQKKNGSNYSAGHFNSDVMKRIILLIVFLASGICSLFAQATVPLSPNSTGMPLAIRMDLVTWLNFVPKDYLAGGKVGTLEIKVRNYDVYKTSSGQYYIEFINSRLTKSRKYLGYKFGGIQEYQGNTIFFSKDTTQAWIWTLDRYGQIYKMNMPDFFATDFKRLLKQLAIPNE